MMSYRSQGEFYCSVKCFWWYCWLGSRRGVQHPVCKNSRLQQFTKFTLWDWVP